MRKHGLAVHLEEQRVVLLGDGGHDADGAILANARAGRANKSVCTRSS
jgi:shikimate 5-dehydrogenase